MMKAPKGDTKPIEEYIQLVGNYQDREWRTKCFSFSLDGNRTCSYTQGLAAGLFIVVYIQIEGYLMSGTTDLQTMTWFYTVCTCMDIIQKRDGTQYLFTKGEGDRCFNSCQGGICCNRGNLRKIMLWMQC